MTMVFTTGIYLQVQTNTNKIFIFPVEDVISNPIFLRPSDKKGYAGLFYQADQKFLLRLHLGRLSTF